MADQKDTGAPQPAGLTIAMGGAADSLEWHSIRMDTMQVILTHFAGKGITEKEGQFYKNGVVFARQRQGMFFLRLVPDQEGQPPNVLSLTQEQIFENINLLVSTNRKKQKRGKVTESNNGPGVKIEEDGKVTVETDKFGLPPSPS